MPIVSFITNYLTEIQEIDQSDLSLRNKYIRIKRVMERSCKEITGSESLQFPSLFSRLVFIAQKYNLSKALEWQLQSIRVKSSFLLRNENNLVSPSQYQRGKEAIITFLSIIDGDKIETMQELKIKACLMDWIQISQL
mgnify:CR=1 FL=1